jgi:hypothetical protein
MVSRKWRLEMKASLGSGIVLLVLLAVLPAAGKELRATVIYDNRVTAVNPALEEQSEQLWITTADLTRATRFEVKPQGVCRDELCFPLPKARQQEFVRKNAGHEWFNLTAFAALVSQPVAHDAAESMWYFGLRSDQQQRLSSLRAPDFTLPDMNGKAHSLSDFRGKKVFLITWASW